MAPCAVCVVAIGGGLGISRALGIDDALTGVWIGGLLLAVMMFLANWLKNKWPKFPYPMLVSFVVTYLFTVPFFFVFNLFAKSGEIFGISRLAFGMLAGTAFLSIGLYAENALRQLKADHKAFFPFQKVIVPVVFLILATLLMWFLIS